MKKSLIIHIGTDKTGSTAVQSFLSENADLLREESIRYLVKGRGPYLNHNALYIDAVEGKLEKWNLAFDEIYKSPEKVGLISFEGFYHLDSAVLEKIKKVFKGFDIKIVVYLRRQSDLVRSGVAQRIKQGSSKLKSYDYTRNELIAIAQDYNIILNKFAGIFGRENIYPRIYEKYSFVNGNIFDDFLSVLGSFIESDGFKKASFIKPPLDVNPSLDVESIAILDRLDAIGVGSSERRKIVSLLLDPEADSKSTFVTSQDANFIDDFFDAANSTLAREWFGKDKLFVEESKFVYRMPEQAKLSQLYLKLHNWLPFINLKPWKGFEKTIPALITSGQIAISENNVVAKNGTALFYGKIAWLRFLKPLRGENKETIFIKLKNYKDISYVSVSINGEPVDSNMDGCVLKIKASGFLNVGFNGWVDLRLNIKYKESIVKQVLKMKTIQLR